VNTSNEVEIHGNEGWWSTLFTEISKRDEVNLEAVDYCYSCKTPLHFVLTENAGSAIEGDPYEMKYMDH
jgi:hypothetical protein